MTAGRPGNIRACLFDLDGVLTETLSLHAKAWQASFADFLRHRAEQEGACFVPFESVTDYDRYVSGKSRSDGLWSFLAVIGTTLPESGDAHPAGSETVHGPGRAKKELLVPGAVR